MITVFLTPYLDELFYSLIARYAALMQFSSKRAIFLSLFNTKNYAVSPWLAMRLKELIKQLPQSSTWTVDHIIDEHTLLPFVAPFLPVTRVQQIRTAMEQTYRGNLLQLAGLRGRQVKLSPYLRYCPACVVADRQKYGETYWHRLHQMPGVLVCPIHQVWLADSPVSIQAPDQSMELVSAEQAGLMTEAHFLEMDDLTSQTLLYLAQEYAWLSTQPGLELDLAELRQRYLVALISRNLASPLGKIFRVKLTQEFQVCYSSNLLRLLQCELPSTSTHSWLIHTLNPTPTLQNTYPLYHLLLTHFLGFTFAEMLAQPTEYLPFGQGNWPCLNPVCSHYQQPSISTVHIDYSQGGNRPRGIFTCECGFTYSRWGPDSLPADPLSIRKNVLAYGPLWEKKLITLWLNRAMSFRRIAAELRIGDVGVMKRQAARLGLHATPDGRRWQSDETPAPDLFTRRAMNQSIKREVYRTEWRTLLASEPNLTGTALLEKHNQLYQWLYRNDREWLLQNMPPTPEVQIHRRQVNWIVRDAEVSVQIREIAMKLKLQTQPFRRVTTKALLQGLGQLSLFIQLDKLPQTALALAETVETVEEFALRRVWQVAKMYCLEGVTPPPGKFAKRAGVAHIQHIPVVMSATVTALELLNQPIPDYQAIDTHLQEIIESCPGSAG